MSPEKVAPKKVSKTLMRAVTRDDLDAIQAALNRGSDPNARFPVENWSDPPSPFLACRSLAALDLVLASGGDVQSREDSGDTLGHRLMKIKQAKPGQEPGMVLRMLDAGLDVNAAGQHGSTMMHWAVLTDFPIEELIARGATFASNGLGETPLHLTAYHGMPVAMRLLLQAGAEVNATDRENRTPLWRTVSGGHPSEVTELQIEMLLEAGASVDVSDPHGDTLLDDAAQNPDVLSFLKATQAKLAGKSLDKVLPAARGATPTKPSRL